MNAVALRVAYRLRGAGTFRPVRQRLCRTGACTFGCSLRGALLDVPRSRARPRDARTVIPVPDQTDPTHRRPMSFRIAMVGKEHTPRRDSVAGRHCGSD